MKLFTLLTLRQFLVNKIDTRRKRINIREYVVHEIRDLEVRKSLLYTRKYLAQKGNHQWAWMLYNLLEM